MKTNIVVLSALTAVEMTETTHKPLLIYAVLKTNQTAEQEKTEQLEKTKWPESLFFTTHTHAQIIKATLNALSYSEFLAFITAQEPHLTEGEIHKIWLESDYAQYNVHTANRNLLANQGHFTKVNASNDALAKLAPPTILIEVV